MNVVGRKKWGAFARQVNWCGLWQGWVGDVEVGRGGLRGREQVGERGRSGEGL